MVDGRGSLRVNLVFQASPVERRPVYGSPRNCRQAAGLAAAAAAFFALAADGRQVLRPGIGVGARVLLLEAEARWRGRAPRDNGAQARPSPAGQAEANRIQTRLGH